MLLEHLGGIFSFSERWCCQKIKLFYLKCKFCLGPYSLHMHFRYKSSVFYEFDDKSLSFLSVLDLFPLNYDQSTFEYCFSERGCCQKIMPCYLEYHFYLCSRLNSYIYDSNLQYFRSLMTDTFLFLIFWPCPSQFLIRTPWGIVYKQGDVARTSFFFFFFFCLTCHICLYIKTYTLT